jgi:ribonuclease HI
MIDRYKLYFDGASKGNPGISGSGAVIYKNDIEIFNDSQYVGDNETNNVAEYTGLIIGLIGAIKLNIKQLVVYGDSQLIIKQMNNEYNVNSLNIKHLYNNAKNLTYLFDSITFAHVYRKDNTRADELANDSLN